jgi:hypothetical protein
MSEVESGERVGIDLMKIKLFIFVIIKRWKNHERERERERERESNNIVGMPEFFTAIPTLKKFLPCFFLGLLP